MRNPLPSIERITGLGLLIAAFTILVLAVVVLYEVQREIELNRDLIGAEQVKDGLESVRVAMHELKYSARDYSLTGRPEALQAILRRQVEIDADLRYLAARAVMDDALAVTMIELDRRVKAFTTLTRELAEVARQRPSAQALLDGGTASEAETLAWEALERTLDAQTQRINDRAVTQIRVGESLKLYVLLLLVGSIVVLGGLFAVFMHTQARVREAQRRIERLAHFDPVTGLPNRTLLSDRLSQETARAQRGARHFALALFDLDGFKAVNDTYGHAAGDALLAEVASRARASVRTSDTVGRLGGDEFLAILPETSREGALQAAEKLRAALERPYAIGRNEVRITASVGASLFPEHGKDTDQLYRAADAALYAAKREGKNRVRIAGDVY